LKDKIKIGLMSFLSLIAVTVNMLDIKEILKFTNLSSLTSNTYSLGLLMSVVIFGFFYVMYYKYNKKSCWQINVLSIIFSVFMIFGNSYMKVHNAGLIFGHIVLFLLSVLMAIGYFVIFRFCLSNLFYFLDRYKCKNSNNKFLKYFSDHPFIVSLIIMLICWSIYIVAYYPVILSPDPSYQIKQFFGIRTKYADYAILIDESMQITNHHPVLHTLLIGSCLKIGTLIGNDNLGLFLYSVIQISILACTLSYSIKYMVKNMNIANKVAMIFLIIYSIVPVFPFYAMSAVKDVIFSSFIVLYVILLHRIVTSNGKGFKIHNYLGMLLLMILIILFRNNGIYVIMLSMPVLFIVLRKKCLPYTILFITVLGFNICYNDVILPYFKITPGSVREMLSIPFQQTARYSKYHGEELSEKDIAIIDKVLVYDTLADRYDPELADPVKNKFNKYATDEDLKKYFSVWFDGLVKHPNTYIDATIENVYGYFYPEKLDWYIYAKFDNRIVKDGFDYHYNSLEGLRDVLSGFGTAYAKIPIIGLIANIGFNTWLVLILFMYCLYRKEYKKLVIYLPALISIIVCVASPANTYFRYAFPYILAMPIMIASILEKKDKINL
jgi:hypothetical protein